MYTCIVHTSLVLLVFGQSRSSPIITLWTEKDTMTHFTD